MRLAENDNTIAAPDVTLRIPGAWREPREFFEALPRGVRATEQGIALPDGAEFELYPRPADDEFPGIFAGSCPKEPSEDERRRIEEYTVNMCLVGRGGSVAAARQILEAGAAVLAAGGAGVFVDNSGLAHGAGDWLTLRDSADDGGVYWAFVGAVQNNDEVYSIGMHVLGFRDAIIPRTGHAEFDFRTLHSFLGFTAFSGAKLSDGDVIGDTALPTFCIRDQEDDRVEPSAPMFNPYGRWRLTPVDVTRN